MDLLHNLGHAIEIERADHVFGMVISLVAIKGSIRNHQCGEAAVPIIQVVGKINAWQASRSIDGAQRQIVGGDHGSLHPAQ